MLQRDHKLYVWTNNQLEALNYYRHNKPNWPNWQDVSKVTSVHRLYPDPTLYLALIIRKYYLDPYWVCQVLFGDGAIQTWIMDAQLDPICNITSWAPQGQGG